LKLGEFEAADSVFARARGLMFRRSVKRPLLFTFQRESQAECAIHAFFVFFPFDAIYLDGEKRVVDIYEAVRPFTPLIVPKKKAKYLVEAPAGWAKKRRIRAGDRLYF
jgi:uncharacterized membrane protein (UPF0127 family)